MVKVVRGQRSTSVLSSDASTTGSTKGGGKAETTGTTGNVSQGVSGTPNNAGIQIQVTDFMGGCNGLAELGDSLREVLRSLVLTLEQNMHQPELKYWQQNITESSSVITWHFEPRQDGPTAEVGGTVDE